MPKLIRRMTVLAKVEATYNTDSLPVPATDGIRLMDVTYGLTGQRITERPEIHGSLANLDKIIGPSLFTFTGSVFINGSGTAGTAPGYGSLIRACSCDENIVATTSVSYSPVSSSALQRSVTIYIYEDGILYILTGCRGNMVMEGTAGGPGKLTFTMTGHYVGRSDVATPVPTLQTAKAPVLKSSSFTVGAYTGIISKIGFDLQNEVVTPDDVNATDSYGEIIIAGRDMSGTIDPETTTVATKDFLAEFLSGLNYPLNIGPIGTTAGNIWQLTQPAIQYSDWAPGDRDGIRTDEVPYGAYELSGDDDFTLTLT